MNMSLYITVTVVILYYNYIFIIKLLHNMQYTIIMMCNDETIGSAVLVIIIIFTFKFNKYLHFIYTF